MMMRNYLFLLIFATALLVPALAEDAFEDMTEAAADSAGEKKDSRKKAAKAGKTVRRKKDKAGADAASGVPAVVEALNKFKFITVKPNLKADYYIYLYSASWCGFCRMAMPVLVDEYRNIKRTRKVEVILICGDKSEKEAKDYLKSYRLRVPCMMFDALKATQFRGLPGCGMPGFPAVSVVDKEGRMITNVLGGPQVKDVLTNWKEYTVDRPQEEE